MIVQVKTQKQLDIFNNILGENWRKQGFFEDPSRLGSRQPNDIKPTLRHFLEFKSLI
ncbi:hypothetical protein BC30090_p341 (plasmid) [Bacillus cereus]|nr:hypothetical protein BC30090_p341 [Bacillus cereus]